VQVVEIIEEIRFFALSGVCGTHPAISMVNPCDDGETQNTKGVAEMKKVYVAFKVKDPDAVVTEYLRYAGIIEVNDRNHNAPGYSIAKTLEYNNQTDTIITMECPRGLDGVAWANMNTARLASFGIKAVSYRDERPR
jgi:hypothetical protein